MLKGTVHTSTQKQLMFRLQTHDLSKFTDHLCVCMCSPSEENLDFIHMGKQCFC